MYIKHKRKLSHIAGYSMLNESTIPIYLIVK